MVPEIPPVEIPDQSQGITGKPNKDDKEHTSDKKEDDDPPEDEMPEEPEDAFSVSRGFCSFML